MHNNKQNPNSSSDVQPGLVPPPGVAETAEERVVRQARIAAEGVTPVILSAILSAIIGSNMVGVAGTERYLKDLLGDRDAAMEAVDQMLFQTCVVAYYRSLNLQLKAETSNRADEVAIYNNAASKMIGKVGELALVLKKFRAPPPQKSVQIVGQQNVVANGDQSVTYVDAGNGRQSLSSRDEVNSNPSVDAAEGRISGTGNLNQESPSGGGGAAKPDATAVVV